MAKKLSKIMLTASVLIAGVVISGKVRANSYYSVENAPEFYGTTKAVIQLGDEFDISLSKFRIFARDFEDGDMTSKIKVVSNNVNAEQIGEYSVEYTVTDSDGNKTSITVPISVVDNEEGRYYERTLYSLPSISNMQMAGTLRGSGQDRQMLGFYMEANSSINVKKISGNQTNNLTLSYYNNNSATESTFYINSDGKDITSDYQGVPFISTVYGSDESVVIGISVTDETGIYDLPYYHYQDNEKAFMDKWEAVENSYAVIENEDVQVLIPYGDREKLTNYYDKCHESLDDFLMYWHKVMNQYDEYLGLSYNPEDEIDQNVKSKYFMKANVKGAGSAYYSGDHVGINGDSVAAYFYVGWGGLHEVGHGYQGSLAHSGMEMGEVSNNILGHYVQINNDIYQYSDDWLGKIPNIEEKYNSIRKNGEGYTELDLAGKLYMLVNLLDTYDSKDTYAKINQIWRRGLRDGANYTAMDAYTLAFYELYNVNVAPYFEAWNLEVSLDVREKVKDAANMSIIYDIMGENSEKVKTELNKEGIYSLALSEEINRTGSISIKINIDDIQQLKGKKITLKNGDYELTKTIIGDTIEIDNIPAGTYTVILPTAKDNIYVFDNYSYINVQADESDVVNINYEKYDGITLKNDTHILFNGLGNARFAEITFDDKQNVVIKTIATQPHVYFTDAYATIKVYDKEDNLLFEKEYVGNQSQTAGTETIENAYKLVIMHREYSDRLVVNSDIMNEKNITLSEQKGSVTTYIIGEYGIDKDGNDYEIMKDKIDAYAEKLKADLTEIQLDNKEEKNTEKRILLASILELKDEDRQEYLEKYRNIYNGSSPTLDQTEVVMKKGDSIYDYVSASDVEDGKIELNEENSIFNVTEQLGTQNIEYKIMDIDNNVTKGILKVTQEAVQESSEETTNEKTTETTSEKTTETTSEEATETTSEEATETTSEEISDTHNIATSEETSIYENVTKTGDSNKMIRCLLIVAIVSALVVFIQNIAKNKGE